MAFKASKIRSIRRDVVAEGSQLIPTSATQSWYNKQMDLLIHEMIEDYKKELLLNFKTDTAEKFYAEDASVVSLFKKMMARLESKWFALFKNSAKTISDKFVKKVDASSKAGVNFSISTLGIKAPRETYTQNINNTMKAGREFNETLITGLQEEAHKKIADAIMLSLTSPNPEQQGQKYVMSVLADAGISSKKRAKLIARDQNSKMFASLNHDRMEQNGITHFKWVHSSAGKVPRHTHVAKDGMIFALNDHRLWEGPKSDQGPPGWAINCRCRAVPVLDVVED